MIGINKTPTGKTTFLKTFENIDITFMSWSRNTHFQFTNAPRHKPKKRSVCAVDGKRSAKGSRHHQLPRPRPFFPPPTSHFICRVRGVGKDRYPPLSRGKWGSFGSLEYIKEVGRARQTNPVRLGWEGMFPMMWPGLKPPSPLHPPGTNRENGRY